MRFFRNKKGVTAIEFALTAPMVLLLILTTIEISWYMLSCVILEGAVRQASRTGITGDVPVGMTRDAYIKQQVTDNLIIMDPANLTFTTQIYDSFANINQPEPFTDQNGNHNYDIGEPYVDSNGNAQWDADMGVAGAGGSGAIVVYKVTYAWKMMTPLGKRLFPE